MKTPILIAIPGGIFIAGILWWIGEHLSSDAIGMALGLGFGVLASIPAALLVFVASRHRPAYSYDDVDGDTPSRFSTLPPAPPTTGNTLQTLETSPHQAPLVRRGPTYDYSGSSTVVDWHEPVPCVLLWPGRPTVRQWWQFTTPLNEALASGGVCYVLESEWNRYVMQQEAYR